MLTLSEAVKSGRLQDFIAQEEARGVGPIDHSEFDALTAALVKAPLWDKMEIYKSLIFMPASPG